MKRAMRLCKRRRSSWEARLFSWEGNALSWKTKMLHGKSKPSSWRSRRSSSVSTRERPSCTTWSSTLLIWYHHPDTSHRNLLYHCSRRTQCYGNSSVTSKQGSMNSKRTISWWKWSSSKRNKISRFGSKKRKTLTIERTHWRSTSKPIRTRVLNISRFHRCETSLSDRLGKTKA